MCISTDIQKERTTWKTTQQHYLDLKKKTYGEKLIGLWLYESLVGIDTDEWKQTQQKIAKVKSVLQDVCYMLADNDKEIALHYYLSYINYIDQKTNRILDELD